MKRQKQNRNNQLNVFVLKVFTNPRSRLTLHTIFCITNYYQKNQVKMIKIIISMEVFDKFFYLIWRDLKCFI